MYKAQAVVEGGNLMMVGSVKFPRGLCEKKGWLWWFRAHTVQIVIFSTCMTAGEILRGQLNCQFSLSIILSAEHMYFEEMLPAGLIIFIPLVHHGNQTLLRFLCQNQVCLLK